MTATPMKIAGVTVLDAVQFAENAERITNNALTAEMLELYDPDAVVEWIIDGAYERHEGIDAIRPAVIAMSELWRARRLHVRKHPQCADADHLVLTYDGGFSSRTTLLGAEIWTLRSGLVVHHQMYAYLDVRPRSSLWAQIRVAIMDPRTALRTKLIGGSRQVNRRHIRPETPANPQPTHRGDEENANVYPAESK